MFLVFLLVLMVMIKSSQGIHQIPFASAELSSTYETYGGNLAIDGNLTTLAHSICEFEGQEIWLKVWLKWPSLIDHFVIYASHTGHSDYTYYRIQGAKIYTKDGENGEEILCGTLTLDSVAVSHTIECSGVNKVRVVVIRLQKSVGVEACIHLLEIVAFGDYIIGKISEL